MVILHILHDITMSYRKKRGSSHAASVRDVSSGQLRAVGLAI